MNQIVLAIACGVLAPIVGFRVGGLVLLAVLGMAVDRGGVPWARRCEVWTAVSEIMKHRMWSQP